LIDRHHNSSHRPEPQRIEIGAGFELYLCDLTIPPSREQEACLSAGEQHKATRFVFERDRRRYRAAHVQLRALLSGRCGVAPAALEFAEGQFGKPRLNALPDCAFNLSHSEDLAVVLIANHGEVGVDIEMLRSMPDAQVLAERNFSRSECKSLRAVEPGARDRAFLTGWTRKEACLKAIGSGLSIAPDTFTAGLHNDRCTATIPTAEGTATVTVQSFCHEERCIIAWAKVEGGQSV
jgi:4'-phosphopantetheinyl transferase